MKPKPNMTDAEKIAYGEHLDKLEEEGGINVDPPPKPPKKTKGVKQ